ncbi:LysR family transcriptional regulator [Pseudoprimorskyibacter insulae]|uniref:HTH-type transcriptional regulator GltC n=1 Tax=Pseudoprimorskyibacter insulae TaxID=1695997 RepID=A0A2R8AR82_9RHOB|nr:LysR family transcriptional regulator [Pseudoprimorskyibacter insulae]SPF78364.1 HTH-type transcriptional regulator GltC [Pseudoprimorskyibacter insulae]
MRNLDVTTLRSFVAVAESGGVTRAAGFLNLTQSAVSMQLKRLEELLDLKLLERAGRTVALTPAGEQLLVFAKRMVALNDEAFSRLTDNTYEGEVILGVPHDIVYPVIPRVMQRFNAEFPRVKVQLISSYTSQLVKQFSRGEVDVILTTESTVSEGGETLAEVPLRWVAAPGSNAVKQRPLRLAFCRLCRFRPGALRSLEKADVQWEMAVESENDRAVEASVSADLAVTAMLEGHAPQHLDYVDRSIGLPELDMQKINVYVGPGRPEILQPMRQMIRQGFEAL